jgi:hypothetical protein
MAFQVSHLGEAYEADLGADVEAVAVAITAYGPDPRWSPLEDRGTTKRRRRPEPGAPDAAIASVDPPALTTTATSTSSRLEWTTFPSRRLPAVSLGDTRRPQRGRAELGDSD